MPKPKRYITDEDGVLIINPDYEKANPSSVADSSKALAIISSNEEMIEASKAQKADGYGDVKMSKSTAKSIDIIQGEAFVKGFQAPEGSIDANELMEKIGEAFAKYEIPMGLLNKLLMLLQYNLHFIIDDSPSMTSQCKFPMQEATDQIKAKYNNNPRTKLTRWDEAENRLHIMIDLLQYIPTPDIEITFLNRKNTIVLSHAGKTPEQFAQEAHDKISQEFSTCPHHGSTPILESLTKAFRRTDQQTMHYLFTDGEPNPGTLNQVEDLILTRDNPEACPLTFITCTDDNAEADWMKVIEEKAPFVAELDDFVTERNEVLEKQGPSLPFSRGFWLICHLVAAINPNDLDALDESTPFTIMTLGDLLGHQLTMQEYDRYFSTNPNSMVMYEKYIQNNPNTQGRDYNYNWFFQQFAQPKTLAKDVKKNLEALLPPQSQSMGAKAKGFFGKVKQGVQNVTQQAQARFAPRQPAYNPTMYGQQGGGAGAQVYPGSNQYNAGYRPGTPPPPYSKTGDSKTGGSKTSGFGRR